MSLKVRLPMMDSAGIGTARLGPVGCDHDRCDAATVGLGLEPTPLRCRSLPLRCAYHGRVLWRPCDAQARFLPRGGPGPPLCAGAVKCLSSDLSAQWHAPPCSPVRAPTLRRSPPIPISPG